MVVPAEMRDDGRSPVLQSLALPDPHWLHVVGEELENLRLRSHRPKRQLVHTFNSKFYLLTFYKQDDTPTTKWDNKDHLTMDLVP
jgi:hypothetical protein